MTVRDLYSSVCSTERCDHLVIATGAEPAMPALPGVNAKGIFKVSWMHDMLAIERFLAEQPCRKAVIVGGGYIGLEMAEALYLKGLDITLTHSRQTLMPSLDENMGELINEAVKTAGIHLMIGERAKRFASERDRVSTVHTDRASYPADIVVL